MNRSVRLLLAVVLVATAAFATAGVAWADFENSDASNQQEGDNAGSAEQAGGSESGDAVGGQVTGIVSSGDASVDAKNRSEDVDVESGTANAANDASSFVGLNVSTNTEVGFELLDFEDSDAVNQQDGDNTLDLTQAADASSGDGVGGQVIGVVTSAGGSADVVADNASEDVDVETGDANADNAAASFVGLNYNTGFLVVVAADFENSDAVNQQDGDNDASVSQEADASSGDGVAGQVIGVVSAGDASVDARNRSEDVEIETGNADAHNAGASFVGLNTSSVNVVVAQDFEDSDAVNQQDGDNELDLTQMADASTGDGVGGQVIGVVTSAGGSADVVADNASEDIDVETGDADAHNGAASFVGLNYNTNVLVVVGADFENSDGVNQQDGDNLLSTDQVANASTGDGVGGQVIGVVSAGDASIDARNRSEDVDVETGDADAHNGAGSFVGLNTSSVNVVVGQDFEDSDAVNQQDGDNELDLTQMADASTGDGVAGQVIGVVTSAGGSADVVADNASEDVDVETGNANADNSAASFVGLNYNTDVLVVVGADFENSDGVNQQEGDNSLSGDQLADASSGDGVAGQVLGIVSAGDASLDARNRSEDVDLDTGNANADNTAASFVGLNTSSVNVVVGQDFETSTGVNQQDGDNDASFGQTANASSGDAVGGQVAGIVTSAGGSADAVLDNASEDIDGETGESVFENDDVVFVGLNFNTGALLVIPGL